MINFLVDCFWYFVDTIRDFTDNRSERQKRLDWAIIDRPDADLYLDD